MTDIARPPSLAFLPKVHQLKQDESALSMSHGWGNVFSILCIVFQELMRRELAVAEKHLELNRLRELEAELDHERAREEAFQNEILLEHVCLWEMFIWVLGVSVFGSVGVDMSGLDVRLGGGLAS